MSPPDFATRIFTGHALARRIQARSRAAVTRLGRAPVCAVLLDSGSAPAAAYLGRLRQMAAEAGAMLAVEAWPATAPAAGERLAELSAAPGVDAVLALHPLPAGLDPQRIAGLIGAARDAEGQHPDHAGALLLGHAASRVAPTAMAAFLCAQEVLGDLAGAGIVLVGTSARIGRPLSMLLLDAGATPVLCHAGTRDLAEHTRRADLVISAAGVPGLLGRRHLAPGGRVLDLAVVRTGRGLEGDADLGALLGHAGLVSHVPDGVGPVTAACLLANVIAAATGLPAGFAATVGARADRGPG